MMDCYSVEQGVAALIVLGACVVISFWLTKERPDE